MNKFFLVPFRLLSPARSPSAAMAGMLCFHAALLGWSGWIHSPTFNEPAHLAAGVSNWHLGSYSLFTVNPPLVRMVASLPILALNPRTDWARINDPPASRSEDEVGVRFLLVNAPHSARWIAYARWSCIPFSLIGGWLCFEWARRLYGNRAGLLAGALWCFSPYILGFASLISADAHAAAVGAASIYAYWFWLKQPDWSRCLLAGSLLGAAQLTKFSLLVFYPLLPILWVAYRYRPVKEIGTARWGSEARMLFTLVLLSVFVINLGYGFEGSFQEIGSYKFHTMAFSGIDNLEHIPVDGDNRFKRSWFSHAIVPLPSNYVGGIDLQLRDFEKGIPSYLNGNWSDHGWWYYYLYALAIKEPLGTWCLVFLALLVSVAGRRNLATWRDELVVVAPGLSLLVMISSQTGFSVHSRYIIPALPFLYVWTSKVALAAHSCATIVRRRVLTVLVASAATWSISSSIWNYPHSISYFNEIGGGSIGGPRYLLNSNIDWSQDLWFLKQWLDEHPSVKLDGLKFYGNSSAFLIGLPKTPFPPRAGEFENKRTWDDSKFAPYRLSQLESSIFKLVKFELNPKPGWYALSVNEIYGRSEQYRYFLNFRPVARAGHSIYIYNITANQIDRVRRKMGLPTLTQPR